MRILTNDGLPLTLRLARKIMMGLGLFLALSSCDSDNASKEEPNSLVKLKLMTDWYAEPEHGGFYLALIRGYYADAGIDLEITPGNNFINIYQMVATGEIHIGLGTSDTMLKHIGTGIPLVGLYPYFQHDPQGIMFHREQAIESFAELNGRDVMISPVLGYVEYLQNTLDIQMNLIPHDGSLARFIDDKSFIQQAFLTSEPYFVQQGGADPAVLPFWEMGYDPYRLAFSHRKVMEQYPQAIKGFIEASQRGWQEFMAGDTEDVYLY